MILVESEIQRIKQKSNDVYCLMESLITDIRKSRGCDYLLGDRGTASGTQYIESNLVMTLGFIKDIRKLLELEK